MKLKQLITVCLVSVLVLPMSAQTFSVSAVIDSTILFVGEQTKLTFEWSQPKGVKIQSPFFSDTLVSGLEIVERLPIDTLKNDDASLLIKQSYLLTAFDSALFFIPPQRFILGTDTQYSNPLALKILSIPVDTTQKAIADIKPVYKPPFNWPLFWNSVLILLLVVGFIFLGVWLYRRYKKHHAEKSQAQIIEDARPAYEIALERLDAIRQEKMWQKGRPKEYHTQLTDVLRDYLHRRFGINASEQTSGEMLAAIQPELKKKKESFVSLQGILQVADLVKFAKYHPLIEEDEKSLSRAYSFVEDTKEVVSDVVAPGEKLTNEQP
ncbi:MAG: DUF4381 family protein [Paludibacteraceae bacterium]|nr:DUF4381 family protein [Paludibacteraceae bacterium]